MSAAVNGIDELRAAVRHFGNCTETFLQQFTAEELIAIRRAWVASGWDFSPDRWETWQVDDALAGHAPQWDNDELPLRRKVAT